MRALLAAALGAVFAGAALGAPLTDSVGRTIDLPASPAHVVPAGAPAEALLLALAPDRLMGVVEAWSDAQKAVLPDAVKALPKIPRLTGHATDADIEGVKALKPDLIVDYGDTNGGYGSLADKVQAATGVPTVLFTGSLEQAPDVVRKLGATLGATERAETLATAVSSALDRLDGVRRTPPRERVSVYYGRGADGLKAVTPYTSLAQAISYAGGRIDTISGDHNAAFVDMKPEQVAHLKPQVVIVADEQAAAPDAPLRKALPPETRFLVDRGLPFGAIEHPPSLNQIAGALALAEILYPDKAKGAADAAVALNALLFPGAPKTPLLAP